MIPMYVLVELWTPRPAFLELSPTAREAYFASLDPYIAAQEAAGITTLGWDRVDEIENRPSHEWFAVWQMPDRDTAAVFLDNVQTTGWYDYFEQVNIGGTPRPVPQAIADHIAGGTE